MEPTKRFAEVIVDVPARNVDKVFHYLVPAGLRPLVVEGMRVLVPFGSRKLEGYVIGFSEVAEAAEIKEIAAVLDKEPIFTQELIELARWMAGYYVCPLVVALQAVLPAGIKVRGKKVVILQKNIKDASDLEKDGLALAITEYIESRGGEVEESILRKEFPGKKSREVLEKLESRGIIKGRTLLQSKIKPKEATVIKLALSGDELQDRSIKLTHKQKLVAESLLEAPYLTIKEISQKTGAGSGVIQSLIKKGILIKDKIEVNRDPYSDKEFVGTIPLPPTPEQKEALGVIKKALANNKKEIILLHGVTGSGKTEIYLQAIDNVLSAGKQAIVLVPEISLTPQMVECFKSRLGQKVAVLHSRLSLGERYDEWRKIKERQVEVVVGARSAVFAPFQRLGLIIIDEEHENSYKQEDNPKYHAREVAEKRAELCGAVLVLGSATPAVETYYKAKKGIYSLVSLEKRVDERPLPSVEVVDLREEIKQGNRTIFSTLLREKIADRLYKKEQIILFLNRRGFSTFVVCRECGLVIKCPRCDISLTYHANSADLRCHYCNFITRAPEICPRCRSKSIRYFGVGTQKVEDEIKKAFPQARVLRMDVDTTARKGSHEKILSSFKKDEADILVGTQMIAKGHDFPKVTLVGVITADTALNLPDFRAGERTFQLLTQVAGRAGRGNAPGEVIIQTYAPEHYSVLAAKEHNYLKFYNEEIGIREALGYPPFSHVVKVLVSGSFEKEVVEASEKIGCHMIAMVQNKEIRILGPAPAPLSKIKNRYRWQILLAGPELNILRDTALKGLNIYQGEKNSRVTVSMDVEPSSML